MDADLKTGQPRPLLLGALLLAAFAARAAFAWLHPGTYDVDRYVSLALSVLERGEYGLVPGQPSITAAPLFPLWIAGLYSVFGRHPFAILLANAALSTATAALLCLLGRRLFSRRAGLLALALWAGYPYAVYYCAWSQRESLLVFLACAMLWLLLRLFEDRTAAWAAASGAVGGLLGLSNPTCLIFVGLVPLGMLLQARREGLARLLAAYYLCLGLCYSPWVLRNQLAFGRPILTNVHGGINLYQGMMLKAEDFGTERETEYLRTDPVEREGQRLCNEGREFEANALYQKAGREAILAAPGRYAARCLERFLKFWRPVPYRRAYPFSYAKVFWASLLSDGLLLPLGLGGLLLWRRRWQEFLPLLAMVLLWPLSYYLVYAVVRFRMPVMPVFVLFAAALLDQGWRVSSRSMEPACRAQTGAESQDRGSAAGPGPSR